MAEITAGMVKELREKTDAPMMECKKALTEADGDMAKAEEILRVKLGQQGQQGRRARHRRRHRGDRRGAGRQERRAGRSQLRNRLRRQERRLPGLRPRRRATGARAQPGRRGRAGALALDGAHGRGAPHRAGRQDRREHVDPPLRAHRRAGARWPSTCTAARASACWSTSAAATRRWPRTWRCTSPPRSRVAARRPTCRPTAIAPGALGGAAEGGRSGQAGRDPSQMVEGSGAEVPQGSDAAGPALRRRTTSRPSSSC